MTTAFPGPDPAGSCPRAFLLFADGTEAQVPVTAPWPASAGKITVMLECPPGERRLVTGARIETCRFTVVVSEVLLVGDQLAVTVDGKALEVSGW